jgi:signal-transduction protein with cAMP-binding, CBS, and nucleotidyltransferase domain
MSVSKMLKGHELFQTLSVEEIDFISSISSAKTYKKGETIFNHGGAVSHVFLLLKGVVHLRLPANPPEFGIVVSTVEQGEMFGLSPLLGTRRYTSAAVCGETSKVLAIEAKPFRNLLKKNSLVGLHLMTQVAQVYFARYMEVLKNLQGVVRQIALIH